VEGQQPSRSEVTAMQGTFAFLRFVTKAALNYVGFGVAGDFVAEALPEMARDVYKWWGKGRPQAELRAEIEALAQVSDEEAKQQALQAVASEAAFQPESLQLSLITYLAQVPAAVRQTQRRPADPAGRTVIASLAITRPADILALLPPRLPLLQKGQRAPGFGDWILDELLGIGGFGEVWKATNRHLPPVALKFCLDPTAARFLRNEADLLGRVVSQGKHPGIVALLDTALESDPPCLKYEYVSGGDLTGLIHQWHDEHLRDIASRSLHLMHELAGIVAFAHRLSPPIVHRDLKPANILIADCGLRTADPKSLSQSAIRNPQSPMLKVADFGIGTIVAGHAHDLLASAPTRGRFFPTAMRGACTPLYASPQQERGEDADPRDDVYALGVIWYQVLTGKLFERPGADWREELVDMQVPGRVLDVIGRCLAVRGERRLANAGELADALTGLVEPPDRVAAAYKPAAVVTSEPEEEELDTDSDDPIALATLVQRSLQRAQLVVTRASVLVEQQHDYAGAVKLLEGLPEGFRDSGMLDLFRQRRDRVEQLRREITGAARAHRFPGLRDRIEELLELTPQDDVMRRLHATVPWEPGEEVVNSIGMKLTFVKPGVFQMGATQRELGWQHYEGPVHAVEITRGFYLGAFPVTQEHYQKVMGTNPSRFRRLGGCDTRLFPVENISWEEAASFCRKLSEMPVERQRGRRYRLPTEAEWEHACRAGGDGQPFHFGVSLVCTQANFDGRHPYGGSGRGDFLGRPSAVGSYPANVWGLYDMHGNIWEWCADWFDENFYRVSPKRDPRGPDRGEARVLRGGSWQSHGRLCRSACRDWVGAAYRSINAGFRVVLVVGASD
jgi:formylglycine-generating enzyme required for sulfatase activity/serine/threonine protein kinase